MNCNNYHQQTYLDEISEIKIEENRLINDFRLEKNMFFMQMQID